MLNVDRVAPKLQRVYIGQTSSSRFEELFRLRDIGLTVRVSHNVTRNQI